jgi:hypothetical protein
VRELRNTWATQSRSHACTSDQSSTSGCCSSTVAPKQDRYQHPCSRRNTPDEWRNLRAVDTISSRMLTTFSAVVRTALPSWACRHLEKHILTIGRKVAIACLGLSAHRPRILVGEVAAWSSLSLSSQPKKKVKPAMYHFPLAVHKMKCSVGTANLRQH